MKHGNLALIFAGGFGQRMNSKNCPKQFLEHNDKPIIIYTLEHFEQHSEIDGIIVVCIEAWIPYLEKQLKKFEITKVVSIVSGGQNGQESIYKGLKVASNIYDRDSVVLVHDGVRPLIHADTITENIHVTQEYGCCITCAPATETCLLESETGEILVTNRANTFLARAPQTFMLGKIGV